MAGDSITLDDVARLLEPIYQGLSDLNGRFGHMNHRLDGIEFRLATLETGQRDIQERLERVEGETQALRDDVAELYARVG